MKLNEWLRAERKTQEIFASEIGRSQSYIAQLCAGTKWPSKETAQRILTATHGQVTMHDFLQAAQ